MIIYVTTFILFIIMLILKEIHRMSIFDFTGVSMKEEL
jgi:hypothetical protein